MTDGLSRSQKRQQAQFRNDATAVLGHAPSVRFLCRILEECGYFEDQFTGNSETFYRLGQRKTGMRIVQNLEAGDPNALLKLLQSAAKERANNGAQTEEANDED